MSGKAWKLVPVEPTSEMLGCIYNALPAATWTEVYHAMLAAAPTPPDHGVEGLDLDALEKVARAATPGDWRYRPHYLDDWGYVRAADESVIAVSRAGGDADLDAHRSARTDPYRPNGVHISTFNPETVLKLIALARSPRRDGGNQEVGPIPGTGPASADREAGT